MQGDSLDRPDAAQLEADETSSWTRRCATVRSACRRCWPARASSRSRPTTWSPSARSSRRHGGLYSSHIRNEGVDVFDAVKEAIAVGRRAGVPVDIIHLKIADQSLWGRMREVVALIEQRRREGVNVQANVYPYTRGNNDLVSIIPPWAHEGGKGRLIARLKDRSLRDRLKQDIRGRPAGLVQPLHGGRRRLVPHADQRPSQSPPTAFRGPDHGPDHRGEDGWRSARLPTRSTCSSIS